MTAGSVRYSPDVGQVSPDGGRTIDGLDQAFDTIPATVAEDSCHAVRSVHAGAHGVLEGTTTGVPELAPELAHVLLAAGPSRAVDAASFASKVGGGRPLPAASTCIEVEPRP